MISEFVFLACFFILCFVYNLATGTVSIKCVIFAGYILCVIVFLF